MQLTPEEIEDLEETFQYNDLDHDGRMAFDEFVSMLSQLEAEVERAEARIGFREIDVNRDGAIEFDEFIQWWSDR